MDIQTHMHATTMKRTKPWIWKSARRRIWEDLEEEEEEKKVTVAT